MTGRRCKYPSKGCSYRFYRESIDKLCCRLGEKNTRETCPYNPEIKSMDLIKSFKEGQKRLKL